MNYFPNKQGKRTSPRHSIQEQFSPEELTRINNAVMFTKVNMQTESNAKADTSEVPSQLNINNKRYPHIITSSSSYQ